MCDFRPRAPFSPARTRNTPPSPNSPTGNGSARSAVSRARQPRDRPAVGPAITTATVTRSTSTASWAGRLLRIGPCVSPPYSSSYRTSRCPTRRARSSTVSKSSWRPLGGTPASQHSPWPQPGPRSSSGSDARAGPSTRANAVWPSGSPPTTEGSWSASDRPAPARPRAARRARGVRDGQTASGAVGHQREGGRGPGRRPCEARGESAQGPSRAHPEERQ